MTRDRLQDSTALYRDRFDYKEVVQRFAERRGFPTNRVIVELVRSNLQYLRERFDKLAAAFDRLRRPASHKELGQQSDRDTSRAAVPMRARRPSRPPERSAMLNQSMARLRHNLVSEHMQGRKARVFDRSAHFELNMSGSAGELRAFNADIRNAVAGDAILKHGSHQPNSDASVLSGLTPDWKDFLQENWHEIFAAQWAETQATLQPLVEQARRVEPQDMSRTTAGQAQRRSHMPPEKPLLDPVDTLPPLSDQDARARAVEADAVRPALATTRDIASRVYVEPERAVETIVARYVETGDRDALVSEIEREPGRFATVKGAVRLGIANGDRRNALEQAAGLATQAGRFLDHVKTAGASIVQSHRVRTNALQKPLMDLSSEATQFLGRVEHAQSMKPGPERDNAVKQLLGEKASTSELGTFHQALADRYGTGRAAVAKGLAEDPAFKSRPASEQTQIRERIQGVTRAIPVIAGWQHEAKAKDRGRDVGKDRSFGLER